ncbi:RIKEN cDNA 1190005I06 [Mus musculus]|nr:RIKEN cDNA 1190005I06 [Mus musculus]
MDGQKSTAGGWPQRSRHPWPLSPHQPRPRLGEEEATLPYGHRDHGPRPSRPQSTRTSRQSRASVFYKLFYRYGTYILSEIYK